MGRAPIKRHNKEFRRYFERLADTFPAERSESPRDNAIASAAEMLGVSWHTVKSWLRPEGGKAAAACPKWRVAMFKLALPPELSKLSDFEREQLIRNLHGMRELDAMDPDAAKAFDKLV